jgi:hypothetical protein
MNADDKEELAAVIAELIRTNRQVHQALLAWTAFNPYIEFKW